MRFSTTLVTDTWTRPRTSRKERPALYYSEDQCNQWKKAAAEAARRQAKRRRQRQNVADAHLREGVQEAFAKEDAAKGRPERDSGAQPSPSLPAKAAAEAPRKDVMLPVSGNQ